MTYSWTTVEGNVAELTATSNSEERVLQLDHTNGTSLFAGYRLLSNGEEQAVLNLAGAPEECVPLEGVEGASHVVSAQQDYSYNAPGAPDGFDALMLEFDTRNEHFRLLRHSFADPVMSGLEHVSSEGGFDWVMVYPEEGSGHYVADQPDLIANAYLTGPGTSAGCGREFEEVPFSVFGQVSYKYRRLSGYLAEQVE